ncbi:triose-phosphate isomerase [candidate division KSB1 bacterium]|nr:triose-phosphate isomerase [candidate division KSB1 bacterium]
MRKRIIAGNWKMNKTLDEAVELASQLSEKVTENEKADVVICPPYTNLSAVAQVIKDTPIGLGAQNLFWEPKGAYTGEISAEMLKSAGCEYVILGHSERRQYCYETDETVNKKIKRALQAGLVPIVCVGELLEQRKAGDTEQVVKTQIKGAFDEIVKNDVKTIIIAYEPVWAIGTGEVATPQQAQDVHKFIRTLLANLYDEEAASCVRIQYGGSMKPANAAELLARPDIDGGLIGGASLDAESFLGIVRA